MNIKRLSKQLYFATFSISLLSFSMVEAAETDLEHEDVKDRFIEIGGKFEYSDNVHKLDTKKRSGTTLIADIEAGYQQQQENSKIKLNYYAQCGDESEDTQANNCYWIGNTYVSQAIFTDNLLFNLNHNRQRYIIDQTQPNLDQNQNERDLLDVGLQWFIAYSTRHTFILGVTHNEAWFDSSGNSDSNSNEGELNWRYSLNEKSEFQLSYIGSDNNFDDFESNYQEHQVDARITHKYRLGSYSFNYGKTWIDGNDSNDNGGHYGVEIDALIRNHQLRFNASRALTNSSQQIGESNELDFSENQLFWRTQVSLDHRYTLIDDRLLTNIRVYFSEDDNIVTINSSNTEDQSRYGTTAEIDWAVTYKTRINLSADYYQTELTSNNKKKYMQTELYGRYNIVESLYIQFSIAYEKQAEMLGSPGYSELSCATRIAYRY